MIPSWPASVAAGRSLSSYEWVYATQRRTARHGHQIAWLVGAVLLVGSLAGLSWGVSITATSPSPSAW